MTTAVSPPQHDEYKPAPVKKRRVASVIIAGVAGVAGIALAATFGYFTQAGDADAAGNTTADEIGYNDLHLGQLEWSGPGYTNDASKTSCGAKPAAAVASQIQLTNKNIQDRQVVNLLNVVPDAQDDLYNDIWVCIERQDPTGNTNPPAPQFKYFGALSGLHNLYMGNIVPGATQTFDVYAWTANAQPDSAGPYHTAFKVNYSVNGPQGEAAVDQVQN